MSQTKYGNNLFIYCFEGQDGVGKSTLSSMVVDLLTNVGYNVMYYSHPGSTILGKRLREIFISKTIPISVAAQVQMIGAARSQLIDAVSNRFINEFAESDVPTVVIIDRWDISTVIYQSAMLHHQSKQASEKTSPLEWTNLSILEYLHNCDVLNLELQSNEKAKDIAARFNRIKYILINADNDVVERRLSERTLDRFESLDSEFKRLISKAYINIKGSAWNILKRHTVTDGSPMADAEEIYHTILKDIQDGKSGR